MTDILPEEEGGKVHSHLGPSSAHRWINCTGSPALIEKLKALGKDRKSGIAAAEGTAAHTVLADCLTNGQEAWEHIGREIEVPMAVGSMKFTVNSEMADAVQVAIDWTRSKLEQHKAKNPILLVEQRVASPSDADAFGTSDIIIIVPQERLIVGDFKYGIGVVVEPDDEQTRSYGQYSFETFLAFGNFTAEALARSGMDLKGITKATEVFPDPNTVCELIIIQPRIPHPKGLVRKHITNRNELARWFYGEVLPAMQETRTDKATLAMGDWCNFCPAFDHCPLIHRERTEFKLDLDPVMLTDVDLNEAVRKLEQIEKQGERLREEMFIRAQKGSKFEDWKLVRKMGNRVWKDGAEDELKTKYGTKAYTEPKLVGPAAVDDLEGGKAFTKRWAMKPDTGLTMAPRKDKRDEVDANPMGAVDRADGVVEEEVVY